MPSMSLGRARWSTEDGSIFSVADGKRLAQEPVRQPTPFEAMRQNRVAKATLETPLVAGMRCAHARMPPRYGMSVKFASECWHVPGDVLERVSDTPVSIQPGNVSLLLLLSLEFVGPIPLCAICRLLPIFTPGRAMMWGTILAMWGTGAVVMSSTRALGISRVSFFAPCHRFCRAHCWLTTMVLHKLHALWGLLLDEVVTICDLLLPVTLHDAIVGRSKIIAAYGIC